MSDMPVTWEQIELKVGTAEWRWTKSKPQARDTRDRQLIFFAEYSCLNLILFGESAFIILSGFACFISMNWGWYWRGLVAAVVLASGFLWFHSTDAANPLSGSSSWTPQRKLAARWVDYISGCSNLSRFLLREKVRELWHHGFDNYMTYGM